MLKRMIEDEIEYEKTTAEKLEENAEEEYLLKYSNGYFHCQKKNSSSKFKYLRKEDSGLLRKIAAQRYRAEKAKILKSNIQILESVLSKLTNYDDETILNKLPKAHKAAADFLRENAPLPEVIQSENPKHRDKLVIKASDGLKVRTKGELSLYETLKDYDLNIRYEKALKLTEKTLLPSGEVAINEVNVYPDFTIIFPDGEKMYLELSGLYDDPKYRRTQFEKFNLYYDNDIYMPENLIVIMESEDKPLDLVKIRRIIEGEILPRIKKAKD